MNRKHRVYFSFKIRLLTVYRHGRLRIPTRGRPNELITSTLLYLRCMFPVTLLLYFVLLARDVLFSGSIRSQSDKAHLSSLFGMSSGSGL